jgi:hypothetical protein
MADDVFTLGAANLKSRKTKSGKERYRIEIKGDSLLINADPKALGQGPAEAIAQLLRDRVLGVSARAPAATIKAREVAAKAFAQGKSWALKRYAGGRIGAMPPNQSDRALNDSGRMAQSIAVGATKDGYTVNMAANRLDSSAGNVNRIWQAVLRYVPELGDTRRLMDSIPIRKALEQGLQDAVLRAREREVEAKRRLMQAKIQVARAVLSLVA